jgi:hypothetical protein
MALLRERAAKYPMDYDRTLIYNSNSLFKRALPEVTTPYTNFVSDMRTYATWFSQQGSASEQWYDYSLTGTLP